MSESSESDRPAGPRGVGGWLAFFVSMLVFFGPSMRIIMTAAELENLELEFASGFGEAGWARIVTILWAHAAATSAISVVAALLLMIRRRRSVVPVVIALLWICGPILNVSEILMLRSAGLASEVEHIGWAVFISAPALLWTLYLLFSRRVRNTYPRT